MVWRSSQRAWTGLAVPIAGLIGATLFEATDERRSFISRFIPTAHTDAAVKSDSKQFPSPSDSHKRTFSLKSHIQPVITEWDFNWDCREPESLVKPEKLTVMTEKQRAETLEKLTPKATRHLILIRHGQYLLDADVKSLTALGREQANLTGQRLKELGIKFDRLTYSTMTRATETGELIGTSLHEDIVRYADSMLEEGAPYPPEPPLGHWRPAAKEFLTDGARIEAAFRKYFHRADPEQTDDSYEILACHGNVIRYFVCRALQFPPEGWLRMSLANCSLTWILIRPSGRVIVKSFGDHGHLPPNMVTFS